MKYIYKDELIKTLQKSPVWTGLDAIARINAMTTIDLADYVPREFHDKTCEAMAKRHQEEIADMVRVVRCENCRKSHIDGKTTHYLWCTEWGRSTDTFGYCERGEREEQ